ncbi:MAG: hypothetical protein ACRC8S_10455 [Fimbriiglobus sp.]
MGNRAGAVARLFEDLGKGDPLAWGFVGFFLILGIALGLFVWKTSRDLKKDDEKHRRRRKV